MSAEENQKQKAKKKKSQPHCSVLNLQYLFVTYLTLSFPRFP